uniref:Uncharacterized protein n=1 Tax=Rhodosorus marinus TaxID=101924 RepID=A0A7S0BHX7_9RHOD|mmetsp:Transcript_17205/g.24676  ORF Transcript_17205/g.24676 Transcript_17205/m.24676 type:complete len:296 (+) Transcript_17205:161-1048(+)
MRRSGLIQIPRRAWSSVASIMRAESVYLFWILDGGRLSIETSRSLSAVTRIRSAVAKYGKIERFRAVFIENTSLNWGYRPGGHSRAIESYTEEFRCPYCETFTAVNTAQLREHFRKIHVTNPEASKHYLNVLTRGVEERLLFTGSRSEGGAFTVAGEPTASADDLRNALQHVEHGGLSSLEQEKLEASIIESGTQVLRSSESEVETTLREEARLWLRNPRRCALNDLQSIVLISSSAIYGPLLRKLRMEFSCRTVFIYDGFAALQAYEEEDPLHVHLDFNNVESGDYGQAPNTSS